MEPCFHVRQRALRPSSSDRDPMTASSDDSLDLLAARFIIATLSLDLVPEVLVPTLNRIERDDSTAVYAVQLESSVGPAAFLIYGYETGQSDTGEGSGQTQFANDLRTLELAQARNVPGPRLVASGQTGDHQFILATDPHTFAALAGVEETASPELVADRDKDPSEIRRSAAEALISLLRDADRQAGRWLRAVDRQEVEALQSGATPSLNFDDVETELALYLLGQEGIRNTLTLASRILETAQAGNGPEIPGDDVPAPTPEPTRIETARSSRTRSPE